MIILAVLAALDTVSPASAKPPADEGGASGNIDFTVHAHSSQFTDTLFPTSALPFPITEESTGTYSSIRVAGRLPFNDTASTSHRTTPASKTLPQSATLSKQPCDASGLFCWGTHGLRTLCQASAAAIAFPLKPLCRSAGTDRRGATTERMGCPDREPRGWWLSSRAPEAVLNL